MNACRALESASVETGSVAIDFPMHYICCVSLDFVSVVSDCGVCGGHGL